MKSLSAAQLKNLGAYCTDIGRTTAALEDYFKRYEGEKLKRFQERHDKNRKDTETAVRLEATSEKWDAAKTAAEVSIRLAALETQFNKDRVELSQRVAALNQGLDGLNVRCEKLSRSQRKLDEYVQLKKSEDAINELATETLGVDTAALNHQVDVVADTAKYLEKGIK